MENQSSNIKDSQIEEMRPNDTPTEVAHLKAEVAALKLALNTVERERDEWRIIAQQCGHLGGEIGDAAKTVEKL